MNSDLITTMKLLGFGSVILAIEYVGINPEMFTLLALLMAFDVATGIGKRIQLGKRDITSRRFTVGVMAKLFVLGSLFFLAWTIKLVTGLDTQTTTGIILGLFIAGELYSSLQNIYTMKTGKEITEYDAVSVIISGLLQFVRGLIEKSLDSLNKK